MPESFRSFDSRSGTELAYGFPRERQGRTNFPARNICIYCGQDPSRDGKLTDEHIIADGLGGDLVVPKASCAACQKEINSFEQRAIKSWFGSMREALAIRSKKSAKKKQPSQNNIRWFEVARQPSGDIISPNLPWHASDKPLNELTDLSGSFIDFLNYPGAILGEMKDSLCIPDLFNIVNNKYKQEFLLAGEMDVSDYLRIIAKISLAYTSACFDGSYTSELDDIILRNDLRKSGLLIGRAEQFPRSQALHQVSLRRVAAQYATALGTMRRDLLVTRIQLFSFADTPTYDVVAGYVSS
jgi:hypothetical protein